MLLSSRVLRNVTWATSTQILRLRRPFTHSSLPLSRLSWTVRHNSTGATPPPTPGSASDTQTTRSDADEPRLSITFTCTAGDCSTRSTHQFTKRAYERGIVLIECPGCKTRHLIADNLGWFKDSTEAGKLRNVEDLLRVRGETVRRGRLHPDGTIEVK
ncbi:DNL zinc finger-domain-containing protein [Lactifluus volemus]|nr:DNL zinc finger-domain-containing protein [Lactifluus volemus]